ncbi:MAG: Lrp/AsnC family transcriptional regulator [Nisaea sp.]|jgi:DNA-binding Lrp family transcriptional regulator|uniref:Lrp/AsnC family transcriptional regulator n=1 Tax=Nisaea sp. TaxID=2024842 RepID=UPI001B174CC0|nr:Lrp/AsnC family transcriptional regulator [Nisaea sp.]MBO6560198.1 Lrp/AsnC family transcriptional regulator [Nisaea sp.]
MDAIDEKLIAALRRDGRAGISELAAVLEVSRATVRSRLERLERDGHILGYTVVLRGDAQELPVRGIMLIEIEGRGTENVVRQLTGIGAVGAIHSTNGRWDLIAEIGAETLTDFDDVLRRIRLIEGIANSETNLLLATRRSARAARAG